MFDAAIHTDRRARLAASLGDGIAIVATAPEVPRNRDTHYPYRHDSYFYWLTGFAEPEAVVVMVGGDTPEAILFCRDRDETREIWDGFRYGPAAAREHFGFDAAYSINELDARLPELMGNRTRLAYAVGQDPVWDARVIGWLNAVRTKTRQGILAPGEIIDVRHALDEMRLIKDAHELALMRRAADISTGAHRAAMRATRPGGHEYEIEAELLSAFRRGGAEAPAYTSIVAGGANACVLHYVFNNKPLNDGDLLLIDAACEFGKATRPTSPAPSRSTAASRRRRRTSTKSCWRRRRPRSTRCVRAPWNAPHDAAVRVLTQGMVDLKLLAGEVDGLIESKAYDRFYMHRTGHWLGLDVHDAGEYKLDGAWRRCSPA
jgi:Xaa-Pro aminopeptidase